MNPAPTNSPETFLFALQLRQVHTITDRFSTVNTYLINDDCLVVVDPGSPLHVRLLLDYLQTFLQRAPSEIDLIVLTSMHPHSTSDTGVAALRRLCSAPVAASALVRWLPQLDQSRPNLGRLKGISQLAGPVSPGTLHQVNLFSPFSQQQGGPVDLWLEDGIGLPFHPAWRVIACPGHAPTSLCLYNPFTRELLSGDTVSTVEGRPIVRSGGNRRQLEETLHSLRSLPIDYLYPGRGRAMLSKAPLTRVRVE